VEALEFSTPHLAFEFDSIAGTFRPLQKYGWEIQKQAAE
jgi:hypothetical protein